MELVIFLVVASLAFVGWVCWVVYPETKVPRGPDRRDVAREQYWRASNVNMGMQEAMDDGE